MNGLYTPLLFPEPVTRALREEGWSIAITGASGWMGQALLEMLEPVFGDHYADRVQAFGSSARELTLRSGRGIQLKPTKELADLLPGKWLLVHAAYGTKDRVSTQGNAAFIGANDALTQTVTQSIRHLRPAAILFPSSGAVYAADGTLSTDLAANPYGVLKQRDERHFTALADEVGARIVIPRLFNMSGPYINKWPAYALSDLIVQLLEGNSLHIQSAGAVLRSYIHVADLLALSFYCLLDPQQTALTFDTRGVDVELAELARHIEITLLGKERSQLRVPDPQAKENRYLGETEPMEALCTAYGLTLRDLSSQIADTAADIVRRRGEHYPVAAPSDLG